MQRYVTVVMTLINSEPEQECGRGGDLTKCKLDILHESIHLVVMWLLYIPAPLATCQYQTIPWTFLHSHSTPIHALMLQGRDLQEFELKHTHIFGYFLGSLVPIYTEKK
jgi:hypothetical protein